MTRSQGRHTFSRRAKLTAGMTGLALTVGLAVAFTTTGDQGEAKADGADKSLFVDITKVKPNVKTPKAQQDATTGTFTVDCGLNENKHFNGDNFIAAPGVNNGAEHLHDYVGNLTTDANSSNQSLQAGGTTCANGDKSAYFWPVIRIDKGEEEAAAAADDAAGQKNGQANKDEAAADPSAAAADPNAKQQKNGQNDQQGNNQRNGQNNQNDKPRASSATTMTRTATSATARTTTSSRTSRARTTRTRPPRTRTPTRATARPTPTPPRTRPTWARTRRRTSPATTA